MPKENFWTLESRFIIPIVVAMVLVVLLSIMNIFSVRRITTLSQALSIAEMIPWQVERVAHYEAQFLVEGAGPAQEKHKNALHRLMISMENLRDQSQTHQVYTIGCEAVKWIRLYRDAIFRLTTQPHPLADATSSIHQKTGSDLLQKIEDAANHCTNVLQKQIQRSRSFLLADILGTLFMVIVLLALMIVTVRRKISRPIRHLISTMERIGHGNIEDRVPIPESRELARLAHAFNEMTDAVYESRRDLMVQRDRLERVVEKRTADLRRLNEALLRSNKELDDFTYIVSHDLKEPLRGISTFTQFLEDDFGDQFENEAREYLAIIQGSSRRMRNLINDLLELSRIGRRRNLYNEFSLRTALVEIRQDLDLLIKEKNGSLLLPKQDVVLVGDEVRLRQVLVNLINNGFKFNRSSEPVVQVALHESPPLGVSNSSHKQSDMITLSIRDNGIGIDPKHHEKIFDIFQRLVSREEFEGTGAGLTICKKVVEDHGGRIWLESTEGKGTTFFVALPLVAKPTPPVTVPIDINQATH